MQKRIVRGEITRPAGALPPRAAVLVVQVEDVSRADAPSVVIGEYRAPNAPREPGGVIPSPSKCRTSWSMSDEAMRDRAYRVSPHGARARQAGDQQPQARSGGVSHKCAPRAMSNQLRVRSEAMRFRDVVWRSMVPLTVLATVPKTKLTASLSMGVRLLRKCGDL
jgi:hypothetical protein